MKRLIVNADDFGFTHDVNAGIVEAHRHGILTATTLMANGDAFPDAVRLAAANPTLDVGCHLVFVQGQSVVDPTRELPQTIGQLVRALIRREFDPYDEAVAQVRKIVGAGIRPSHLDTHKHTHLLPPVLKAVARVAREFHIPWIRRPFDFGVDRSVRLQKRVIAAAMRVMTPNYARTLEGLRSTDYFTGFQLTGTLDATSLIATLARLPDGLTEFMCHPGKLGSELQSAKTRLKESREIELAALLAPATRKALEHHDIQLSNYRES
jgi:predicted glycoside hydrolase/deacetylase ChbG (UPF0249 family)